MHSVLRAHGIVGPCTKAVSGVHVLITYAQCALEQEDRHVTCVLARRLVCPLHGVVWVARRAVLEVKAARRVEAHHACRGSRGVQAATKRWSLTAAYGCCPLPGNGHSAACSMQPGNPRGPLTVPFWPIRRPPAFSNVQRAPPCMRLPVCTPCTHACGSPRMRSSQTTLHLWSGHAECAVGSPLSLAPGRSRQHNRHRWHHRSATWCWPMGCHSLRPDHLLV